MHLEKHYLYLCSLSNLIKMKKQSSKLHELPGKITIKHFINRNLKETKRKYAFWDEDGNYEDMTPPFHPLYVKVTFRRTTTQLKSFIGIDFISIDDAMHFGEIYLEHEAEMIHDVIARNYLKDKDHFSLKGLADLCAPYTKPIDKFITDSIWSEYNAIITTSRSHFSSLLLRKSDSKTPSDIFFKAALKLLDDPSDILRLKEKFEILSILVKLNKHIGSALQYRVIEWVYGDLKPQFPSLLKEWGLETSVARSVIAEMEYQLNRLE